jgi:hypothetical protein
VWRAGPPTRVASLRALRPVLAPRSAPFTAGGTGLGGRELMRGAPCLRRLAPLAGNLSPGRGVHAREAAPALT